MVLCSPFLLEPTVHQSAEAELYILLLHLPSQTASHPEATQQLELTQAV
jgi:hypothetical protein